MKRSERLGCMTKMITDTPNRIHTLGEFCTLFDAAKSTISEDIDLIRTSLERFGVGTIDTVAGAAGGVRYRPIPSAERTQSTLEAVAKRLREPGRRLAGGFLYTSDIASDPAVTRALGEIIALKYYDTEPDLVLTMETKGIPVALMTAHMLNVPLVITRRDSRAYEGSAVKINYVCGNDDGHIETMALSRRSVKAGQRALIVDDFMKGGGTLQGMVEMMQEFQASVAGVCVMVGTAQPEKKRVQGAKALITLEGFDEAGCAIVRPNLDFTNG